MWPDGPGALPAAPRLRSYQRRAVAAAIAALRTHRRALVCMATGTGKTVVATEVARLFLEQRQGRVMYVTHRSELIDQAETALRVGVRGAPVDVEQGPRWAAEGIPEEAAPIVVASPQTLLSRRRSGQRRISRFNPDDFSLLVTDECHHYAAPGWLSVVRYFQRGRNVHVLGFTATPDRSDKVGLGHIYEVEAFRYELRQAILDGWLVPIEVVVRRLRDVDLRRVPVDSRTGDFSPAAIAHVMEAEKTTAAIVAGLWPYTSGLRTLIFAPSVPAAEAMADMLNGPAYKPGCAIALSYRTPPERRREIIEGFRRGYWQYLCQYGIATEGIDIPWIQAVVIARPTLSRALFCQMIGRGTRPVPGLLDSMVDDDQLLLDGSDPATARRRAIAASDKPRLLVVEFTGNAGRHSLITPFDVLSGSAPKQAVADAKRRAERARDPAPVDVIAALSESEDRVRLRAIRQQFVAVADWSDRRIDPFAILGVRRPLERLQKDSPASPKQVAFLERMGVPAAGLTKREASALISQLLDDIRQGRPTPRQRMFLMRLGVRQIPATRGQASELIDQILEQRRTSARKSRVSREGSA